MKGEAAPFFFNYLTKTKKKNLPVEHLKKTAE